MKIVVLDGYTLNPGDLSWDGLGKLGELTVYDRTPEEEIVGRMGDADAILVNKVPVTAETMDANPNLKYIGVLATGYNVVDIEAARARGIVVTNVPGYGTSAVTQHAFALLFEITNRVARHSDRVKAGAWTDCPDWCFWDYPMREIAGKTMGIIGLGRIGQATMAAALAFGMKVLAYDNGKRTLPETGEMRYAEVDELLRESDVIVLHCPLTPKNRHLIDAEAISNMKPGVIILNNSRGPLIDERALYEGLVSGKVHAAGLDVLEEEPPARDNPLFSLDNVFITPHNSWAPVETRGRLLGIAEDNLRSFLDGSPANVVSK